MSRLPDNYRVAAKPYHGLGGSLSRPARTLGRIGCRDKDILYWNRTLLNARTGNARGFGDGDRRCRATEEQGIALGQRAVEEKSNEITAIPRILDQLNLTGAVVTIDAGCQRNIADEVIAGGGEYVPALKGNQETLYLMQVPMSKATSCALALGGTKPQFLVHLPHAHEQMS